MEVEVKFCKDCRFVGSTQDEVRPERPQPPDLEVCLHPGARFGEISPVTGEDHSHPSLAMFQRVPDWLEARLLGYCGKGGRWWKAKDQE